MPDDNDTSPEHRGGFVIDGAERFADAVRASITKEVEAEWSERVAMASWFGRFELRRQIRNEIERRIEKQMPSEETLW